MAQEIDNRTEFIRLDSKVTVASPNATTVIGADPARSSSPALLRGELVENRDRQTVKFAVRALRDDLVENLCARVVTYPAGDDFTQLFSVFRLCCGEDLCPHEHSVSSF